MEPTDEPARDTDLDHADCDHIDRYDTDLERLERDLSAIEVAMRHVDEGDLESFAAVAATLDAPERRSAGGSVSAADRSLPPGP